jgi:polyphenol oxidase
VVAAIHAGWRGVIAGVVPAALSAFRSLGAAPAHAAIGPCIGPDAFEVGPEVLAEFRRVLGVDAPPRPRHDGKGCVDLKRALQSQLRAGGVDHIDIVPGCTFSSPERFYSHRRDRGITGRMIGIITPRADK